MASEAGALPVDQSKVVLKGRLQPGKMFVADLSQGRIISDEELKKALCAKQPYGKWLQENKVSLEELPGPMQLTYQLDHETLIHRQQAFGYTAEDLKVVLQPMAEKAQEPISSMGVDTPLAVLSDQSQHLSNYFKQLFAQVSNPPIDPIRERMVMSLFTTIGPTLNILAETPEHCKQMHLAQPVLTNNDLNKLKYISHPDFKAKTLDAIFPADGKKGSLEKAIDSLCQEAEEAVLDGCNILIISDKTFDSKNVPVPSLLATGAIHHHLIRKRLRTKASLVVEAGDVRETHHFATLIGYGASAINPYIAFETISSFKRDSLLPENISEAQAHYHYLKAIGYGLLKIFSKMGISTLQSYQGAQIFEAFRDQQLCD
jgi:glutamate synthase (NADPH/NADH) large chain